MRTGLRVPGITDLGLLVYGVRLRVAGWFGRGGRVAGYGRGSVIVGERDPFSPALRPLRHQPATPGAASAVLAFEVYPGQLRHPVWGRHNCAEGDSDGCYG